MAKVKLMDIAISRSGDKRDSSNVWGDGENTGTL